MRKNILALILSLVFAANSFGQVSLLECHNKGWGEQLNDVYSLTYKINGSYKADGVCGGSQVFLPQIIVAVIDENTCEPWCSPSSSIQTGNDTCEQNFFGQINTLGSCGRCYLGQTFIWSQTNSESMTGLSNFIDSIVPDSSYILAYTWIASPYVEGNTLSGAFSFWQSDVMASFLNLGFAQFDTINLSYPWIFFCKKGDPSTARKVVGTHPRDTLDFAKLICNDEPFVTSTALTICEDDSASISGNTELLNYLWSTGETTQAIIVNQEGYYVLTGQLDSVYNYGDSTYHPVLFTDSIFIEVVSCTGIEEIENLFSIYPNPAKENINITFKKIFSKPAQINIYNMYGVLMKSVVVLSNKNNIDISVSDFPAGVYFISVTTESGSSRSQKVVVF